MVVATGTAMGVAVGLVVLIPVGSLWVLISAGGTAIAVIGAAVGQGPLCTRNNPNKSNVA